MKYTFALLPVFLSSLQAWGNYQLAEQSAPAVVYIDSPFKDDQSWYVKESLLIWHPFEDGLDFGAKYTSDSASTAKMSVEIPDFGWGTGVRLSAGRYLPNHYLWDVSLGMTYFYAGAERTTHADPTQGQVIVSAFEDGILGDALTKAKARWQLNYFIWDLDIGRSYLMTPQITVHPHLGFRTALIYLDYTNRNDNGSAQSRLDSTHSMWGIGPHLGTDFSFDFKRNWSFLGNLGAALLYTNFSLHEKMNGSFLSAPLDIHTKKSYNFLTTNVEAAIGLGWEEWVRRNTVRIAASFLFEASQWFNMNRLFHLESGPIATPTTLPFSTPKYNRGDLGLIGFSINLQVDF